MKKISTMLLCLIFLFSMFPASIPQIVHAQTGDELVVHASELNMREGAGLSYSVVTTLKKGDTLTLLETNGEWYKVQHNGKIGWVASWMTRQKTTTEPSSERLVIAKVDRLNFRMDASQASTVLSQMNSGDSATYIKESDEWVQVQYNNQKGWVSKRYVTITNTAASTSTELDRSTSPSTIETTGNQYFTVNVSAVNIRKKPNLSAKKLGTIKLDEQYKVLDRSDNWIEIEYAKGKKGWVYSFYGTFSKEPTKTKQTASSSEKTEASLGTITIVYDNTNLRENPSTNASVVTRVNAGETYTVIALENDWYKIKLKNNQYAYVANWVVDDGSGQSQKKEETKKARKKGTLNGLTIVVDAGHGGNDQGTEGVQGTKEKSITLSTAESLKAKLIAAGAEVVMTRESDKYVDLRKRVAISHQNEADAFISLHYDANESSSIKGFTTYYMNSNQKALAEAVHKSLGNNISLKDRGVQKGNYLVVRENRQPAILIELGFLSNKSEESVITKELFREQATQGIYNGMIQYFNSLIQ